MPTLTLYFKENPLAEYRLVKGGSLAIGRRESNDIHIENLAVSGHHARIDSLGAGFLLTDLKSKNGSFVNEELVSIRWLRHGDSITIGKHRLVFTYGEDEERFDESSEEISQAMIMEAEKHRDMLVQAIPAGAGVDDSEKELVGLLSYLSGGQGEIRLTKKIAKFGKNPSSDIVLGGLLMGATAATISKSPKGFSLSYVGGMAKPKVNGEVVKDTVNLKESDVIEIGSIKFRFAIEK